MNGAPSSKPRLRRVILWIFTCHLCIGRLKVHIKPLIGPARHTAGRRGKLGDGVVDAYYRYNNALLDIVEQSDRTDFDGNYARFADKAMRIAMLLASLENEGRIQLTHWARGQEIAERYRSGLHVLYSQLNEPEPSRTEENEEKAVAAIRRHGRMTAAEVARFVRGLSTAEAQKILEGLARGHALVAEETSRTIYYDLPYDEP